MGTAGWGYCSCTSCSMVVIAARIDASSSAGVPTGSNGAPTWTVNGILLRPSCFGWSLVHTRWAPQTMRG